MDVNDLDQDTLGAKLIEWISDRTGAGSDVESVEVVDANYVEVHGNIDYLNLASDIIDYVQGNDYSHKFSNLRSHPGMNGFSIKTFEETELDEVRDFFFRSNTWTTVPALDEIQARELVRREELMHVRRMVGRKILEQYRITDKGRQVHENKQEQQ